MKKLTHFATALANNTLSTSAMNSVKGGADTSISSNMPQSISSVVNDEKRRQRPGGGMSTN